MGTPSRHLEKPSAKQGAIISHTLIQMWRLYTVKNVFDVALSGNSLVFICQSHWPFVKANPLDGPFRPSFTNP